MLDDSKRWQQVVVMSPFHFLAGDSRFLTTTQQRTRSVLQPPSVMRVVHNTSGSGTMAAANGKEAAMLDDLDNPQV